MLIVVEVEEEEEEEEELQVLVEVSIKGPLEAWGYVIQQFLLNLMDEKYLLPTNRLADQQTNRPTNRLNLLQRCVDTFRNQACLRRTSKENNIIT